MAELYIVVRREGVWWVLYEGNRTGPYASAKAARDMAVAAAKRNGRDGGTAKVWFDDPNDGLPEIFSTGPGE